MNKKTRKKIEKQKKKRKEIRNIIKDLQEINILLRQDISLGREVIFLYG